MPALHILLALLTVIIWGYNFVVIHVGLHAMSPITLCALRFFLTAIPAVFFIKRPKIPWRTLIVYGLVMYAFQFGFLFAGISLGVASGLAALILQTQVLFTVVLAAIYLNERPTTLQLVGIFTAFLGIVLVATKLQGGVTWLGFGFLLIAAAFWSIGNLLVKTMKTDNMFALVIWGNFIAFFPTVLTAFLLDGKTTFVSSIINADFLTIISLAYLAYLSTMFSYGCWSWLIKNYPIASIAPYALLVPIVGFVSAAIVLHEPITSWQIIAGLFVVSGVGFNILGARRRNHQASREDSNLSNDYAFRLAASKK